jgi:predicted flap endonuclease-1-like 5' DNA nuclease/uncharacterized protein YoxC
MPEISAIHIAIAAVTTVIGAIVGWLMRGKQSTAEKDAVSAGWQEQISAQRLEHSRLTDQNKGLMEQINQYQVSNMDAKNRAKELSDAVQEAYARRDDLRRKIKDIRANLEVSMSEREQLQSDITVQVSETADRQEKDARIARLQLELENWQNRLPPLIDKFRQRNEDALRLETELDEARGRIAELEESSDDIGTRTEPVQDPDSLTDGRDASNETIEEVLLDPAELDYEPEPEPEPESYAEPEIESNMKINGARDRLQSIKGIGPAIEKTLNEIGIFRFQQIADMSEYEIDRVANRLKGFRSRIYREDWIGQARELRDQKTSG